MPDLTMMNVPQWRSALLPVDATIQDAIRNLNESGMQIVLVATADDMLMGTLTDGDIRRGLLRGLSLASPVDSIVQRNALLVPPQMSRELILQLMQANRIHQLPVVDDNHRVVGLHVWDDFISPPPRHSEMVIMAGGQGTRLRPHTDNCPKPLLPVAGRPVLEHIIQRAIAAGFTRFTITVHYLGHMIEAYFGDGRQWGVQIDYLREETPLGTAGAIGLLDPRPEGPFVISNGDILTDIRYGELLDFHNRHAANATMAVRLHEWQNPFGVIHTEGVDIIGFEEKPIARSHINAGVYVLDPSSIDAIEPGEVCDMPTLFGRVKERGGRTIVYPMHEPWLDLGRPADYQKADGDFSGPNEMPAMRAE